MMLASACETAASVAAPIDWKKPIRWTSEFRSDGDDKRNLRVLRYSDAQAVLVWGSTHDDGEYFAVVNKMGHEPLRRRAFVENVPEEPKDHIVLYRIGDRWAVDGLRGSQAQTKSEWESYYRGRFGDGLRVLVKVPV